MVSSASAGITVVLLGLGAASGGGAVSFSAGRMTEGGIEGSTEMPCPVAADPAVKAAVGARTGTLEIVGYSSTSLAS